MKRGDTIGNEYWQAKIVWAKGPWAITKEIAKYPEKGYRITHLPTWRRAGPAYPYRVARWLLKRLPQRGADGILLATDPWSKWAREESLRLCRRAEELIHWPKSHPLPEE